MRHPVVRLDTHGYMSDILLLSFTGATLCGIAFTMKWCPCHEFLSRISPLFILTLYQRLIIRLLDDYDRDDDSRFWANLTLQIVRNYHEHGVVHDDSVLLIPPESGDNITISKNYLTSTKSNWKKACETPVQKVGTFVFNFVAPPHFFLLECERRYLPFHICSYLHEHIITCQIPRSGRLDTNSFCSFTLPPNTTVFTSEDYGLPYSQNLGCAHQLVDRERIRVPTSGTAVRGNATEQWENISEPVGGIASFVCYSIRFVLISFYEKVDNFSSTHCMIL